MSATAAAMGGGATAAAEDEVQHSAIPAAASRRARSVPEVARQALVQQAAQIAGSLVYLEAGAAQVVEASVGLPFLLGLGALNVCSLEHACSADARAVMMQQEGLSPARAVTVLTTQLLTDSHKSVVGMLRQHKGTTERLCVLCAVSEEAHGSCVECPLGSIAYQEYLNGLREAIARDPALAPAQPSSQAKVVMAEHATDSGGETTASAQGEGNHHMEVVVRFIPLLFCALGPKCFIVPPQSAPGRSKYWNRTLHSQAQRHLEGLGEMPIIFPEEEEDLDEETLPSGLLYPCHTLAALIEQLGVRPQVYAVGPGARIVGTKLSSLCSALAGLDAMWSQKDSAAVVVIDRTVDLVTPLLHEDHLLDRLARTLTGQESENVDEFGNNSRALPFSDIPLPNGFRPLDTRCSDLPPEYTMRGTMYHTSDGDAMDLTQALVEKQTKDALTTVRRQMLNAVRSAKLPVTVKTRLGVVSPQELEALASAMQSDAGVSSRYKALMEYAGALFLAISAPSSESDERIRALEKTLVLQGSLDTGDVGELLCDSLQSVLIHKRAAKDDAENDKQTSCVSWEDILGAIAVVHLVYNGGQYGQVVPLNRAEERILFDRLVEGLIELYHSDPSQCDNDLLVSSMQGILSKCKRRTNSNTLDEDEDFEPQNDAAREDVKTAIAHKFQRLKRIAGLRSHLKTAWGHRNGVNKGSSWEPHLAYLVTQIYESEEHDMTDVSGSTVAGLLKGGLGALGFKRFTGQAKPSVKDHGTLIIYVLGGITLHEVREAQEALKAAGREDVNLLIGGDRLITP